MFWFEIEEYMAELISQRTEEKSVGDLGKREQNMLVQRDVVEGEDCMCRGDGGVEDVIAKKMKQ